MSRVPVAVSFRLLAVTFLVVACCTSSTQALPPLYFQQSILNNSGVPCDDLELMFSSAITNMRVTGNPGAGGSVVANSATSYTVTGLSISDSTEVNVRWKSSGTPNATISGGTWTVAGLPAMTISQSNMNLMGRPAQITYGQYRASATFTNDQDFAVTYTNVAGYIDNNVSNYNIDNFDTPTGTQVLSLASSFVLAPAGDPGDSITYDLGTVNPNDYELVLATAAASSNPANSFPDASAAMVPEPGSGLLVLAIVPMLLIRPLARRLVRNERGGQRHMPVFP